MCIGVEVARHFEAVIELDERTVPAYLNGDVTTKDTAAIAKWERLIDKFRGAAGLACSAPKARIRKSQ